VLSLPGGTVIYAARDPADFRKAFDGLCQIVRDEFDRDPFTGDLFVFLNKRRDRVKVLFWDRNGFWLAYKRLERGTFEVWDGITTQASHVKIDRGQLMMLLEGIDLKSARYRRHFARSVVVGMRKRA